MPFFSPLLPLQYDAIHTFDSFMSLNKHLKRHNLYSSKYTHNISFYMEFLF